MTEKEEESKDYLMDADSELRFEIETKNKSCTVTLLSGMAELFGTELVKSKIYEFTTGAKVAIFTYHGCKIVIKGQTDVCYVAKETPMVSLTKVSLHFKHKQYLGRSNTLIVMLPWNNYDVMLKRKMVKVQLFWCVVPLT